jgi:hypothetical protein
MSPSIAPGADQFQVIIDAIGVGRGGEFVHERMGASMVDVRNRAQPADADVAVGGTVLGAEIRQREGCRSSHAISKSAAYFESLANMLPMEGKTLRCSAPWAAHRRRGPIMCMAATGDSSRIANRLRGSDDFHRLADGFEGFAAPPRNQFRLAAKPPPSSVTWQMTSFLGIFSAAPGLLRPADSAWRRV